MIQFFGGIVFGVFLGAMAFEIVGRGRIDRGGEGTPRAGDEEDASGVAAMPPEEDAP